MAAARLDLFLEQGTSFNYPLSISKDGLPTDLTNHTFYAEMRRFTDGPLVAKFDVIVADQTTHQGDFALTLGADKSWGIRLNPSPAGDFVNTPLCYDVIQVFPDQTTARIVYGTVTVVPGVSRGAMTTSGPQPTPTPTPTTTPTNIGFSSLLGSMTYALNPNGPNEDKFSLITIGDSNVTSFAFDGSATVISVDTLNQVVTLNKAATQSDNFLIKFNLVLPP